MIIPANRIFIKQAMTYRNLSFPLVRTKADSPRRIGGLSFKVIKKDAGPACRQAGKQV